MYLFKIGKHFLKKSDKKSNFNFIRLPIKHSKRLVLFSSDSVALLKYFQDLGGTKDFTNQIMIKLKLTQEVNQINV